MNICKGRELIKIVIYPYENKCNPAIFFSKDLKLSVPVSQQVWPEFLWLTVVTLLSLL